LNYPKFITVDTPEEAKNDGNYYRVLNASNKSVNSNIVHVVKPKHFDEKLKGNIYLKFYALADEEAAANLKGVIESFVESNRNFDFNFENVKCLCDKKVGANLRYEEYTNNEGAIKESIKIAYLAPIGEIEKMKVINGGLRGYIAPLLSWVLRKHSSHEVHLFTKNKLTSNLGSKSNWEY